MSMLRPAIVLFGSLALLTGLAYPLAITGAGRILFPRQAEGSLLRRGGCVVGSSLIGQHTEDPGRFWGRLSATGGFPTHAMRSGGSNLSASNSALAERAAARIRALQAAGGALPVPADLVTASSSGLDPHISPAAAEYQVARVAGARGLPEARVRELVARHTQGPTLGVLGEPRVNALELNLALDALRPAAPVR